MQIEKLVDSAVIIGNSKIKSKRTRHNLGGVTDCGGSLKKVSNICKDILEMIETREYQSSPERNS